jgi:cytoskeletal protein RodZ
MTRTDVVASSRPLQAGATSLSRGSSRACRRLSVMPIVLLLAAALLVPQTAIAAEPTSGYSQTTPTPKTTPTTPTTPTTGTSPSKEEKTSPEKTTPAKETSPATETSPTSTTPTSSSKEKASTLPFTGFDLRWSLGGGLLLIGAGFSLVLVERRQRRGTSR